MNKGEIGESLTILRIHAGFALYLSSGPEDDAIFEMIRMDGPPVPGGKTKRTQRVYQYDSHYIYVSNKEIKTDNFRLKRESFSKICRQWQAIAKKCKELIEGTEKSKRREMKKKYNQDAIDKLKVIVRESFDVLLRGAATKVGEKGADIIIRHKKMGKKKTYSIKSFGFDTGDPSIVNASRGKAIGFDVVCPDLSGVIQLEGIKPIMVKKLCKRLEWTGRFTYTSEAMKSNLEVFGIKWIPPLLWYGLNRKGLTLKKLLREFGVAAGWTETTQRREKMYITRLLAHLQVKRFEDVWNNDGGCDGYITTDMGGPSVVIFESGGNNEEKLLCDFASFDSGSTKKHQFGIFVPEGAYREFDIKVSQNEIKNEPVIVRKYSRLKKYGTVLPLDDDLELNLRRMSTEPESKYFKIWQIIDPPCELDPHHGMYFHAVSIREKIDHLKGEMKVAMDNRVKFKLKSKLAEEAQHVNS